MDATFSTSETRYPLYTLMVFDDWKNGIPVAFFVISQSREKNLHLVLQNLLQRAQQEQHDWSPNSIIVDNAQVEIKILRSLWPNINIFLCLWHVRKAWYENVVKKIASAAERSHIFNALGNIIYDRGQRIDEDPVTWA